MCLAQRFECLHDHSTLIVPKTGFLQCPMLELQRGVTDFVLSVGAIRLIDVLAGNLCREADQVTIDNDG